MNAGQLSYPILCLAKDDTVFSVSTSTRLTKCSSAAWRNGFFNKLLLVDPSGRLHQVVNARKRARTLWQRVVFEPVLVDLEIKVEDSLTLDELKARILAAMASFPDPWDSAVNKDLDQWRQAVQAQESIESLIRLLILDP